MTQRSSSDHTVVVAAVIERDGQFLVTLRPDGTHLAGHWEFPGGKPFPTESHTEALRRELYEELDIVCNVGERIYSVSHAYADKTIELHFYRCEFDGEPKPMLGQKMKWARRSDLGGMRFPEADAALIQLLAVKD